MEMSASRKEKARDHDHNYDHHHTSPKMNKEISKLEEKISSSGSPSISPVPTSDSVPTCIEVEHPLTMDYSMTQVKSSVCTNPNCPIDYPHCSPPVLSPADEEAECSVRDSQGRNLYIGLCHFEDLHG